ncbi:PAS domain-containing protein [Haloferax sp. DFSO60]|uniref:PAS domain-containing protein n=1 Tax=Haloferax sp. DFSO60 TaxID=3388652 RepID=UPI00397CF15D
MVNAGIDELVTLDRVSDSVLVLDTDARVVYANDVALDNCRTLGYDGELVGEIFWDTSPRAAESQLVTEVPQALAAQEPVEFREHYEPLDVWFETRVYPTEDSVTVYSRNVSEEVRRGEDLERFETITKTMQDGVCILDETNSLVLVNDAFARMVGSEPETLIDKRVSLVLGEEIAEQTMTARDGLDHGETHRFETTVEIREAPMPVEVLVSSSPIDDDYTGTVCVVHDLTQRKQLEAETTETKRERDVALDRVDDSIYSLDEEWRFTYANRVTRRMARLSPDHFSPQMQLLGEQIWDVFPDAKESELYEKAHAALETQELQTLREYAPHLERWFESTIYPSESGVTVYARDITTQVSLEAEYDEKNRVLDRVSDMVWGVDNDWQFAFANEAALAFAGRSREDLIGEVIWDVFPEARESEFSAMAKRAMETRESAESLELSLVDGLWFETRAYPSESGITFYVRNVTEQKLLKSELDEMFDRITDGFYALDNEWRVVFWNAAMEQRTGRTADEVLGKNILELFPEVFKEEMIAEYERAFETQQPTTFEIYHDEIDVWNGIALYPSESGLSVYSSNVTERKKYEQELEETKTRLELALDGANTGIWEWDILEERVVWDGKTSEVFGLEPGEFGEAFDDFIELVHPDDVAGLEQQITDSISNSKPYIVEFRFIRPSGEIRWAESRARLYTDETGEPVSMLGVTTDVTERRAREQALRDSEMRLRSVVENAPVVQTVFDADGVVTLSEGRGLELLGRKPGEAVGSSLFDMYADYPDILEQIESVLSGERVHTTINFDELYFETWLEPTFDDDGSLTQIIGLSVDVTDRIQSEQALRDSEIRLRSVVENAPVVQSMIDADGVHRLSEGRGLALIGREPGGIVGQSVYEVYADFPDIVEQVESALAGEHVHTIFSYDDFYFETWLEPIFDDDGTLLHVITLSVDITDRFQYEQTLTGLHRSSRQFLTAETKAEVANVVVETATDVLDLSPVRVLLFDKQSNSLKPASTSSAQTTDGDTVSYGPDSSYWKQFFAVDVSDENAENEICIPLGPHGLFVAESADQQQDPDDIVELVELLATTAEATLDRVEREESLLDREAVLKEQAMRLERLHELNEQLRNIEHVLVMAEGRTEIEQGICQRFVEPDRFAFAWFGTVDSGTVTPTRWAGTERGYLPAIETLADDTEPATIAAKTLEPVVISSVADRIRDEPWRKEALASGYQSVMSVPLVYDGRIYGVLTVYATGNDAFDRMSRSVIEDLGGTIAYAINSVETKRGFLSDRVVELALRTKRSNDPLARLATRTGATIRFDGLVHGAEHQRIFFTATGVSADDIVAGGEESTDIESIRVISEQDDGGTFEMLSSSSMFVTVLADRGAVPRTVESTPDETLAIVELPHLTDVGGFIQSLRPRFNDIELTARRDRERAPQTKASFAEAFKSAITPRQLEVLETAYFAGYFDSPRTTNGQDVASLLSITQPTFNYHLRAGERTLLRMLIDESPGESR